jgi:hypothetical protein
MSFNLYLVGFVVLIVGLAYGAYLAHVPPQWIVAGVVFLLGVGIIKGVGRTRHRDPNL